MPEHIGMWLEEAATIDPEAFKRLGPSSEDIVLWPNSTWCYRHELHEYAWMSDDYAAISAYSAAWHRFDKS
jgi:hypothetical protein